MCALPMLPLTGFTRRCVRRVWLICNLGFLALALWILRRVTNLSWRRLLLLAFLTTFCRFARIFCLGGIAPC